MSFSLLDTTEPEHSPPIFSDPSLWEKSNAMSYTTLGRGPPSEELRVLANSCMRELGNGFSPALGDCNLLRALKPELPAKPFLGGQPAN